MRIPTAFMSIAFACLTTAGLLPAAEAAKPGPLACHKQECAMPGPCQVREAEKCVKGQCPAIVNAPDGTSCNDANVCTQVDVCAAGACVGTTPQTCLNPTDTCSPQSGCATSCGPAGCTIEVAAAGSPTLTVPAGALSGTVLIKMTDLGSDPTDPSVFHVYDLQPSGTTFASPAIVDLPAPALNVGESVVIEVNDGSGWVAVATTLNAGRVSGPIAHFSACRTRVVAPTQQTSLDLVDMVDFQDVVSSNNLGGLVVPGCDATLSLHGVCFTVQNNTASAVSVVEFRAAPWACGTEILNYPSLGPPLPAGFEGEHCDASAGNFLFSCGFIDERVNLPSPLAPGAQTVVQYDLTAAIFAGGCSGWLVGVDILLREPTTADPTGGIRSAKDGPSVLHPDGSRTAFQGIYPTLKFTPSGSPIKNFLNDARE